MKLLNISKILPVYCYKRIENSKEFDDALMILPKNENSMNYFSIPSKEEIEKMHKEKRINDFEKEKIDWNADWADFPDLR